MNAASPGWTVLIPVKATSRGKSRIDLPPPLRRELALAMALDTVSAAARSARVLVVVEDAADAAALRAVADVCVHRTRVTGLNESIRDGLGALGALVGAGGSAAGAGAGSGAGAGWAGAGGVAVLPGDLPALRSDELTDALLQCAAHPFSVVADHQGVGTTLLAATDPAALVPRYGPSSFRLHQGAGAVPIDLPAGSSLRWDIDTIGDLGATTGPFTAELLARLGTGTTGR